MKKLKLDIVGEATTSNNNGNEFLYLFIFFVVIVVIVCVVVASFHYNENKNQNEIDDGKEKEEDVLLSSSSLLLPWDEKEEEEEKRVIWLKSWSGGFGNHLHQFAYCATYAQKYDLRIRLPRVWGGTYFFKPFRTLPLSFEGNNTKSLTDAFQNLPQEDHEANQKCIDDFYRRTLKQYPSIRQQQYWYSIGDKRGNSKSSYDDDEKMLMDKRTKVIVDSIFAYDATNFSGMSLQFLRKYVFAWTEEVQSLEIYQYWFHRKGTYDVAHVRRGDSIPASWFIQVSMNSYEKAFLKYGIDSKQVIIISDDHRISRNYNSQWQEQGWKYSKEKDKFFLKHVWNSLQDGLEDFLILCFARTIFRANSSFSFWGAAFNEDAKIYSPSIAHIKIEAGRGKKKEYDVEFVEGNDPHWFAGLDVPMTFQP
jgi:hypothetical protein